MEYKSNFEQEKKHLDDTIEELSSISETLKQKKDVLEEEVKEAKRMYAEGEIEKENYSEVANKELLLSIQETELAQYTKHMMKPYFGKIVYLEEDEDADTTIYLGKKGFTDPNDTSRMIVVDWRAPISDVYYSNNLGEVKFKTPIGENTVDLKLKTTFDIADGKLLDFYDSEMIANDELLAKYLSKNKDVVLNEIIATIQEDQNNIIRIDPYKNVVVQGVAGSGKTTVALHRIAYLLYNYPDYLCSEEFYIIASNKLFLNYITSMLPDLDVYNINQGILPEVLLNGIKKYDKKFKCEFAYNNEDNYLRYKDSSLVEEVNNYFRNLEDEIFKSDEIKIFGKPILTNADIDFLFKGKDYMDLMSKAEMVDRRIVYILTDRKEMYKDLLLGKKMEEVKKEALELMNLNKIDIFEEDFTNNYKNLVNKYRHIFKSKVKKIKYMDIFESLRVSNYNGNEYNVNDLSLILLILTKLQRKDFFKEIKHIVIDEAQDLNVFIYSALKTIFNSAKFTIVGDVMQNIELNGLHEWKYIIEDVFESNAEYRTLLKSYRNTIEISNFAKKIVEFATKKEFITQPVVRHGDKVVILREKTVDKKVEKLREILEVMTSNDHRLNAIICKDNETVNKLYEQIKDKLAVSLLDPNMPELSLNNYIVTLKDSKGLEFDGVVIWDFDDYDISGESYDYKLLYVAATRALHELYVFTCSEKFE